MVKYSYRLTVKLLLKELSVIFGMQNFHGKGKEALWVKIRKAPCFLQVALIHPWMSTSVGHHIQEALGRSSHWDINNRL